MNRYWMEDSFGKYGVQLDAFGPTSSRAAVPVLPQRPGAQQRALPDARDDAVQPQLPHRRARRVGHGPDQSPTAEIADYDNIFYVSAGEDESSTWQEFGEMKWITPEQVPDAFGPDSSTPRCRPTGPPPATWRGPLGLGGHQLAERLGNTSVEAESSGMSTYAHELSHNLSIPDNYGNPYGARSSAGSPACGT